MDDRDVLILKGGEVIELLTGREQAIIAAVRMAYAAHRLGQGTVVSSFLPDPWGQKT